MESSLPAGGVSWIVSLGEQAGATREALLASVGLDEERLRSPDVRIPRTYSVALWRAIAAVLRDPTLPVRFGQAVRPDALGVLGYLLQHASSLRELIDLIHRFQELTQSKAPIRLQRSGDTVEIAQRLMSEEVRLRYPPEFVISSFTAIIRNAIGESWSPQAVFLQHRKVPWASVCRQVFRCPVHFSASDSGLVIAAADLNLPIGAHDPHLRSYLVETAARRLQASEVRPRWTARVLAQLANSDVGQEPGLTTMSRRLAMGSRTLQRRLRQEGTRYSELVDGVRIGRSKRLLTDSDLRIGEIATRLGYSDTAAFSRAFRRWVGMAPKAWRNTVSPPANSLSPDDRAGAPRSDL